LIVGLANDSVSDHFHECQNARRRAKPVDFVEKEAAAETEEGSTAVGRDDESWRPRRASSASSSLAPRPSESRILLSTRSTRVRLASDKRTAFAYERAVVRLDGDDSSRVRLTALTVLTSAGARIRRRDIRVEWRPIGRSRSRDELRVTRGTSAACKHSSGFASVAKRRDMPRCRRTASRGQVLLLRLLLVCVLVAAGRQEGKFTREALPAGQLPVVSKF